MFAKLWGLMFKDFALRVSNKAKDKLLHAYNTLFLVFLYIYLCKYYICIGSMIGTRITWIYGFNDLFLYCSCLFALVAVVRMILDKRWLYLILALSLLSCFYLSYLIANNDIYVFINICIAVACYSVSYKHILRVFVLSVGLMVTTQPESVAVPSTSSCIVFASCCLGVIEKEDFCIVGNFGCFCLYTVYVHSYP